MKRVLLSLLLAGAPFVASAQLKITAAGATFPGPIYQKWFGDYHKLHPDVEINYQPIGSGAGVQQLTSGTVDFGASDFPMTDEQASKIKTHVLHFPTVLGGVVPIYNLAGSPELKFSGETLAGIFLGNVKKWNDAAITKENPGVKLPNEDIVVVHRSDGSGTTFAFADFLSKVSPEWKTKVGVNGSLSWPVGLGGKGSEGVSGAVKQTPNSIGYVELTYAVQNKMAFGAVKNSAGTYLKASLDSVSEAAAATAKNMPADFRVSIANASGKGAYPISTFTWMLIPSEFQDAKKAAAVKAFLNWMLTEGQKTASSQDYAPLPKEVVSKETKQLSELK
jgi:phosphate transport system substrate-binding protein